VLPILIAVGVAHADPIVVPTLVVVASPPTGSCALSVDGLPWGMIPCGSKRLAVGRHTVRVACADGRVAVREVDVAPPTTGGLTKIVLGDLEFSAPSSPQVPTDVVSSAALGERVSIDGGAPVALPAKVNLTVGSHVFVVIQPDGTRGAAVHKDVVSHDGKAVVNLE
jgi:hypothetical protein